MSDKETGLFQKFIVQRTDGEDHVTGKHPHCDLFVLDLTHDPLARKALHTYINAAMAAGYVPLAHDLADKLVKNDTENPL